MTKTGDGNSVAPSTDDLQCSFCQKRQNAVRRLIAGPSVNICDECVEACQDIIADDTRFSGAAPVAAKRAVPTPLALAAAAVVCALCRLPTPLDDGLLIHNRGVLCQGCVGEIHIAVARRRSAK